MNQKYILLLLLLVFAGTASADYSNVAPYDPAAAGAENWGHGSGTVREFMTYNHEYRIRQDGDITNVTLWVGSIACVAGFNVTVWRSNGSNFDRIAISEDISGTLVANTVNTITLSTPLANIKEGDFYGYRTYFTVPSSPYHADAESTTSTYYVDSAVTTVLGYNWKSQASHTYAMRIEVDMEQPSNVLIGDSIIAGHPAHYSFIESADITVLESAINAHMYNMTSEANQNMGIGGQTTTQISARFTSDVVDLLPGMAIIEGGVNDIAGGSITQTTFLANYESMLQKCQAADIEPVVILIMPWSNGNYAQMTTRDQWNANLTTLAGTYDATVVDTSSYVGIFRAGGAAGNLWDINASYNVDGVHFNSAGHAQIAQAIYDNASRLWHHHRTPTSGGGYASYVNDTATFTAIVNNVSNNTWYLDGAVVEYDNQTKYPSWTNSTLPAASYNLTLSSSDGGDSAQTVWDWSTSTKPAIPTTIGQNHSDWGDYVSMYSNTVDRGNHSITLDHNVSGYKNWWDHWTNTSSSTTLWDVAQDNNGSIGGAAWEGDYLHYDGTGYTALASKIDYSGTDDWSIAFWAELDPGETTESMIMGDTGDYNDFVWLYTGNYYRLRNSAGADADFTGLQTFTGMHQYIMVANGTHLVLYRNNTLINTIPITTSFEMNALGRGYISTEFNFDGLMGSCMVYDKTIAAHERNSIYNGHYKDTGNTTSRIIDAGSSSTLNKIIVNGTFHDSTRCVDVYLNTSSDNATWSGWSIMHANVTSGTEYTAGYSDQKRYWQFRLALTSSQDNQTPIVETLEYKYCSSTDALVAFIDPTPANESTITVNHTTINTSIVTNNLISMIWNWNGDNTTFLNDSCVLYVPFDNNSEIGDSLTVVADVSQYGNNGSFVDGTTGNWTTAGKWNGAMSFDGVNDYIDCGNSVSLQISTSDITVEFWANTSNSHAVCPISKYDGSNLGWYVLLDYPSPNHIYWGPAAAEFDTGVTLLNNWHHITIAQSGTVAKVYIDGNYINQFTGCWENTPVTKSLIMCRAGNDADWFDGLIDEVRIYNRALAHDEINQSYHSNLWKYNDTMWYFRSTQTDLADGTYSYQAFANDVSSEYREVTIDTSAAAGITLGANQHGMLRKNVDAAETFSTIAAGIDHDRCYTWWDSTTDRWESYRVGYSYNAGKSVPKHDSYFVLMDSTGTTISCDVAAAETVAIPAGYYATYLRESTNKTLSAIKTDMGSNVDNLWAFNSTEGAWTDTGSYSVQPNQGLMVNSSVGFNWDGAVP